MSIHACLYIANLLSIHSEVTLYCVGPRQYAVVPRILHSGWSSQRGVRTYVHHFYVQCHQVGTVCRQTSVACMLSCINGPLTSTRTVRVDYGGCIKNSTRYLVLFTVQYSTDTRTVWCSTVKAYRRVLKILHVCSVYPGWCRMLNAVGGGASRAQRGSGTNC